MKRIIVLSATLLILGNAPRALAQTPPPPPAAPQPAAKASSSVTVTRTPRCVTVKVCPGTAAQPAPARTPVPAPPPPPPACSPKVQLPPPTPVCAAPQAPPVALPNKRPTLRDPANTRLAVSNTAEVLGHGEFEVAARQIVGLLEVSVGLGGMFQLSFRTSPVTWFLPDLPFKDSLWSGELKVQIVKRRLFKLALDASYFHVAEMNGLKTGIKAKIGTDRVALHLGLGALVVFPPKMEADLCGAPASEDGSYASDCGGGGSDLHPAGVLLANVGFEARFWRYGTFFIDGFLAHAGDGEYGMTMFTVVPGVRFHGASFAADLGLGVLGVGELKIPFPVVNLSYRW